MVKNVVSDFLSFGVERHDGFLEDVHLFFDARLLSVHSSRFILSLRNRVLEHHELLLKSLTLIFNFLLSLLEELLITLHFLKLVAEIFGGLLLSLGLISDTGDFGLDLKDIILLLLDELLNGLKGLVSLLHTEKRFLPIVEKSLFRHDNLFDFNGSLLQSISSSGRFFFL